MSHRVHREVRVAYDSEQSSSTCIIMALNSGINGERVTGLSCFTAAVLIAASSLGGVTVKEVAG